MKKLLSIILILTTLLLSLSSCSLLDDLVHTEEATADDLKLEYTVHPGEHIELTVTALADMKDLTFTVLAYEKDNPNSSSETRSSMAKVSAGEVLPIGWFNLHNTPPYDAVIITDVTGRRAK